MTSNDATTRFDDQAERDVESAKRAKQHPEQYVNISGLDKAAILAALYNASHVVGMGIFQAHTQPQIMSVETARLAMERGDDHERDFALSSFTNRSRLYFDYLAGRPLKIDLSGDEWLYVAGYDRDNGGVGTAARLIDDLRKQTAHASN